MDEGGTPLLPDSLIYQIFLSLGPADVLAAGLVCRQWQAVSRDEFLWREQFYRYYQVARDVPRHPAATSWYEEFRRLYDTVPCVEVQTLREHADQVLHLSFSHSGYQFASCSKDCTVKIWNNDLTISLLHSADMRPYNWSYTQFSQFNQDDSLLLASGVFLGPHNSSSGEIAVISLDNFALLSRVRNKPYDVFGCWLTETSLISGNLHRIGDITSCSVLWLNNAFQDVESENVNVVKRLFKIQNLNASTIRTVMVADCSRFDSPDLLLDAGAPPGRVFDLGSDSEDEAGGPGPGPAPARTKEGLRRFLDGLLDGRAQPQLSEHALETKVAELLAQGRTKPPEQGMANAHKLLIFTTGCLTYSPHQIGIKQILPHQMTTAGPVLGEGRGSDAFFDALDHVIDVHGHIIGMGLSPDNRYLYVNSRAWPSGSVVADPMQPPPIAEEIDLLVFDLKTMREAKRALRAHRAYTPHDECFFIFLDVSRDFVARECAEGAGGPVKAKVEVTLRRRSLAQLAAPQIRPHMAVTSPSGKGTGQDTTRDSRRGDSLKVRPRTNQPNVVTGVSSGPRKPGARIPAPESGIVPLEPGVKAALCHQRWHPEESPGTESGRASWGQGLLPSGR